MKTTTEKAGSSQTSTLHSRYCPSVLTTSAGEQGQTQKGVWLTLTAALGRPCL